MSFAPEFEFRWQKIIEPSIREDLKLNANRVDYNFSGESVIHDILDGIAHSRLIIVDITSTWMEDEFGNRWPQRNGNVMWELGIAHVMRLPDEIIVIRSDNDPSIFDLTQFRAFQYDPSNISTARQMLSRLATDRLRNIDQMKSAIVQRCAKLLDPWAIDFLLYKVPINGQSFSIERNLGNHLQVPRLFELGILQTVSLAIDKDSNDEPFLSTEYSITPFGKQVAALLALQLKVTQAWLKKVKP